jgi:thiol-disulfide isomerase/thioredoxin
MANSGWRAAFGLLVLWLAGEASAQNKDNAKDTAKAAPSAPQQVNHRVRGRVVDAAGKPLAGLAVSRYWYKAADQKYTPLEPAKTAADGAFEIELTFYYGRGNALLSFDSDLKQGGLAIIEPGSADKPLTIQIGPLVHFHGKYESKELGKPVGWTNTMVFAMPGRVNFTSFPATNAEFDLHLPPGEYEIQGYGSSDVAQIKRPVTLRADQPDLDLGTIDLAASQLAKLKGKPAPTLSPTETRGVPKTVQIADYNGKWVALEFWGYWCGPCVGRALPKMMEIYDDHESERDRFVILTVHSPETKTFADLDEKVKPVVRDVWAGRMIPFPILLDGDEKLQKTFGVQHWPTTVLFDPDGNLVGEVQPEELEAKLSALPASVALPRKLERNTTIFFDNPTLKAALEMLKKTTGADFELDSQALGTLGVSESTKVPLTISGQVSLRSALELLLDPIDLMGKVGPNGYLITAKAKSEPSAEPARSTMQRVCAERIAGKLKESKYSYDFDKAPLAKVAAFFEQQSGENVVLDPRGRLQGKIDADATISGSGKDVPMGEALEKLVGPLGLHVVVRDEVIVLEAK